MARQLNIAQVRSLVPAVLALLLAGCDRPAPSERPVTTLAVPDGCQPLRGCEVRAAAVTVRLHFLAPPRALKSFPVQLHVTGGEPPESVVIAFSMAGMDMGLNRYRMVRDATTGDWRADVTLPVCVSGRSDWIAGVELTTAGQRFQWDVPFVLER